MKTTPHYALLGGGRLARHLRHYLQLEGLPVSGWARNAECDLNTHDLADAEARLRATVSEASHVLLLVSDDGLKPILKQYPWLHGHRLVHCAGALSLPGVTGAHPLMTFGRELYALDTYRAIPFVVEQGNSLAAVLPGLCNPSFSLATEQKALYHALCVMAGNFPQVLWQRLIERLDEDLDLPAEVFRAYLHQAVDNLLDDPQGALTGPLARGDTATQARNLSALGASPLADLYQTFIEFHGAQSGRETEPRQAMPNPVRNGAKAKRSVS
jgi:predicted short-subunit dehydrogenase-like oxidoreductase (DUF2520 family)